MRRSGESIRLRVRRIIDRRRPGPTLVRPLHAPVVLKVRPALHRDLAAVELALCVTVAALLLLARRLARVSP